MKYKITGEQTNEKFSSNSSNLAIHAIEKFLNTSPHMKLNLAARQKSMRDQTMQTRVKIARTRLSNFAQARQFLVQVDHGRQLVYAVDNFHFDLVIVIHHQLDAVQKPISIQITIKAIFKHTTIAELDQFKLVLEKITRIRTIYHGKQRERHRYGYVIEKIAHFAQIVYFNKVSIVFFCQDVELCCLL